MYQRDDLIDPAKVGSDGRTNLQRMLDGDAPLGPDNRAINLHHMIQEEPGPMAEVTGSFHDRYRRALHVNWPPRDYPGIHPNAGYERWRSDYWVQRATGFQA